MPELSLSFGQGRRGTASLTAIREGSRMRGCSVMCRSSFRNVPFRITMVDLTHFETNEFGQVRRGVSTRGGRPTAGLRRAFGFI
jgi:hypothetical protein